MSLVSKTVAAQSADNSNSVQNYEKIINEIKGQSKLSNKLNSIKPTDTIDNETSIETIRSIKETIKLGKNDLWSLCPILLYQLVAPTPLERSGCITASLLPTVLHEDHTHGPETETDRKMGKQQKFYRVRILFECSIHVWQH